MRAQAVAPSACSLLKSVDENGTGDADSLPIAYSGVVCPARGDPLLILSLQKSATSPLQYRASPASRPALFKGGAGGQQK
jgi:hypothetical protein